MNKMDSTFPLSFLSQIVALELVRFQVTNGGKTCPLKLMVVVGDAQQASRLRLAGETQIPTPTAVKSHGHAVPQHLWSSDTLTTIPASL